MSVCTPFHLGERKSLSIANQGLSSPVFIGIGVGIGVAIAMGIGIGIGTRIGIGIEGRVKREVGQRNRIEKREEGR